jgi:hypothetical protein
MTREPQRAAIHLRGAELFLIHHAIRAHNGCAAETCGGVSYDPCALGYAIERLENVHGGHTHLLAATDQENHDLADRLATLDNPLTQERQHLAEQLREIGQGTIQEWMRIIDLEPLLDTDATFEARVRWQNDDGECIVGKSQYGDEYGRFRLTVQVEDLGPIEPIGPENDLGIYGIADEPTPEDRAAQKELADSIDAPGWSGHRDEPIPGHPSDPSLCLNGLGTSCVPQDCVVDHAAPIWTPATVADIRRDDVIRMPCRPETEKTVYTVSPPLPWHVHPAADSYHPERSRMEWTEIKVRFTDGPDAYSFRPDMAVEIRFAQHEIDAINLLGGFSARVR